MHIARQTVRETVPPHQASGVDCNGVKQRNKHLNLFSSFCHCPGTLAAGLGPPGCVPAPMSHGTPARPVPVPLPVSHQTQARLVPSQHSCHTRPQHGLSPSQHPCHAGPQHGRSPSQHPCHMGPQHGRSHPSACVTPDLSAAGPRPSTLHRHRV